MLLFLCSRDVTGFFLEILSSYSKVLLKFRKSSRSLSVEYSVAGRMILRNPIGL